MRRRRRRVAGDSRDDATHLAAGGTDGYAMVALLVGLSIMAVALSVALPAWRTMGQREKEAELVFRGEQYARAITLFQRKYANTFPPTIDVLVEQRFLRRKYLDPITGDEFQPLLVGQALPGQATSGAGQATGTGVAAQQGRAGGAPTPAGLSATPLGGRAGILGVTSKSDQNSLRVYNGRSKYNEWAFVATQASTRAGAPNTSQNPTGGIGGRGVGGVGGQQGQPGRGQQPLPGDRRPGRQDGDSGGPGPLRGGQFQPFGGGRGAPFGGR